MLNAESQTTLRCVTNAHDDELRQWWDTLQADAAGRQWFSDAFPQTYADFAATLNCGAERYALFFSRNDIAGSYWLHDMVDDDPETPLCAWVRGYVAPNCRGNFTAQAWPRARSIFEAWGYRHLFAASHVANKRAITCLLKHMDFTLVGDFPGFTIFEDKPTSCTVCAMRCDDVDLARRMVNERLSKLLLSV